MTTTDMINNLLTQFLTFQMVRSSWQTELGPEQWHLALKVTLVAAALFINIIFWIPALTLRGLTAFLVDLRSSPTPGQITS